MASSDEAKKLVEKLLTEWNAANNNSGVQLNLTDGNEDAIVDWEPELHLKRKDNPELPNTVTILENNDALKIGDFGDITSLGKVYIVGTCHFSVESNDDVKKTIQETQPDLVIVELCPCRVGVLLMEEDKVLEEAKKLNLEKVWQSIKQFGFVQGISYYALLSMSVNFTKQLGMAPGGEFRAAFKEAMKIPGCQLHLGDRNLLVTLLRAFGALSLWQKMQLIAGIVRSLGVKITKEDVEKLKSRDLLEEMLSEMAGECPKLCEILVFERDKYMAFFLRSVIRGLAEKRARKIVRDQSGSASFQPVVAVAVVGLCHVPGIISNWTETIDINELLKVPPKSKWPKYVKRVFIGLLFYGVYKGCAGLYG